VRNCGSMGRGWIYTIFFSKFLKGFDNRPALFTIRPASLICTDFQKYLIFYVLTIQLSDKFV
jgi:hypothetical protein